MPRKNKSVKQSVMVNQLILENLACQRGDKVLFHRVNLHIQASDFVQIEGHNGIGKTSLLRIIAGLASPLEGEVRWNSDAIAKQREAFDLLYLGHQSGIKPELNAWENLRFYQQITSCRQGDEILWDVLQTVGLLGREDIPAAQLSAGQQKRIALARLWLSKAPLWILDEPFNGVEEATVTKLIDYIKSIKKDKVIIISTHIKEDLDNISDVIIKIEDGKIC